MMIFDTDGQCYVATKIDDFKRWEIIDVQQFKEGVKIVHCKRKHPTLNVYEYRGVYCRDKDAPPGRTDL
jgi:hypothetical protein